MKALKILLGSFLIAVLLIVALAVPVWLVYDQGSRFVRESEQVARNRALEMAITLNTLSGESLYYDNMVALSHTMYAVVRQSQVRKDAYEIEEIFLLDKAGKLISHSDIARVAADSGTSYDKEKFRFGELRFKGDPLSLEITERVRPEFGDLARKLKMEPLLEKILTLLLPDLTASRYHISGSVYMPDEEIPSATLHMLVQNQNAVAVLSHYSTTVLQSLGLAVIGAGMLWVIFTIVLTVLVMNGSAGDPGPASASLSASSSLPGGPLNEAEFQPLKANPGTDSMDSADIDIEADEIGYDNELEPIFNELPLARDAGESRNVAHLSEYRHRKKGFNQSDESTDSGSRIYDAVPLDRI